VRHAWIALLALMAGTRGSVAAQEVTPRRELDVATLRVLVVDQQSHEPVAGAELFCMTLEKRAAELERRWGTLAQGFDPVEYDDVIRGVGIRVTSGSDGVAELPRMAGTLRLVASDATRWAALEVAAAERGPVTLELAAQETLDVFVVDAKGKGVAGIPVAAGWRPAPPAELATKLLAEAGKVAGLLPDSIDDAWPAGFDGVVTTRGTDGRARFPHASDWFTAENGTTRVVVLAFPVAERVELRFGADAKTKRHELVLPPLGRVVLKFPGVERGVAQLRRRTAGRFGSEPFWRDYEPARAAIVDGEADFRFVGVGVPLQYRATWPGLAVPIEGTLEGPRREEDLVDFEADGELSIPRLCGRLLDEEGGVIARHEMDFWIGLSKRGSGSSSGAAITTTAEGRFECNLVGAPPKETRRTLTIKEPYWHEPQRFDGAAAMFDVTAPLAPGRHELGDVVLWRPGSLRHVRQLDDDALERLYFAAKEGCGFSGDPAHDADSCLAVMAERSGPRWIEFFEKQLEPPPESDRQATASFKFESNITLLTALRRAQRKRDPCTIEVAAGPVVESVFPDAPIVGYTLRNVDELRVTLRLTSYELGKRGMNRYCRIEARDEEGREVRRFSSSSFNGGGMGSSRTIEPEGSAESSIDLRYFLERPRAGEYRARLHHHHGHGGSYAWSKGPLDGWIVTSSPEFTLRVLPRVIRLNASERARLRALFDSLDPHATRPLVCEPWHPDPVFQDGPRSPADELFGAGWTSVPVLLDVLDERDSTPEAKAWALALLASITPLRLDARGDQDQVRNDASDALGRHHDYMYWPTLQNPDHRGGDPWSSEIQGPEVPDSAAQAKLIAAWHDVRTSLAISE